YSWATVLCTLLLLPVTSWLYVGLAVLFGAVLLVIAQQLHSAVRNNRPYSPMKLFHYSNSYLALVFVAVAVDAAIGLPVLGCANAGCAVPPRGGSAGGSAQAVVARRAGRSLAGSRL